jgi:hypothetical protein
VNHTPHETISATDLDLTAQARRGEIQPFSGYALCQGCARLQRVCDLVPDEKSEPGLCPACGGDTCQDACCMWSLPALAEGRFVDSDLQPEATARATFWTAEEGLVWKLP